MRQVPEGGGWVVGVVGGLILWAVVIGLVVLAKSHL